MSELDISRVLEQMRAITAQAQSTAKSDESTTQGVSFSSVLQKSLENVNQVQQDATKLATAFEAGDTNVDVTEVMVALQKASISFQAMTQVRNKLVAAYQDVMNMPI